MPNFTQIGQTVWISIRYEHIYIYIFFVLYILDYLVLQIPRKIVKTNHCGITQFSKLVSKSGHYVKAFKC